MTATATLTALRRLDIEPGTWADFGPFRVRLVHDCDSPCPWEDCDGMTPLWTYAGRDGFTVRDDGDGIDSPLDHFTDGQISRHWRAICNALAVGHGDHDAEARQNARDYGEPMADARRDLFTEEWNGLGDSDRLATAAALYDVLGWPNLNTQRNGYSQGDWVEILLVSTPAHAKRCGFDPAKPGHDVAASLESQADLFGYWAFGDCYGFQIQDRATGASVDSCFGFFGPYWEETPGDAWEAMAESIDWQNESRRKARLAKIKEWIRHRVPLNLRARFASDLPATI